MVKLDKIYTRGGDSGLTSLGDGKRVEKYSLRIKAYGEVDEVNSILGIVICHCNELLKKTLFKIQNDLFDIGADLCIPSMNGKKIKLNDQNILFLEKELDNATQNITKLILLHDTKSYGEIGDNGEGLNVAIENFLKKNSEWKKLYFFEYNNGLSVLIKNE